MSDSSQTHELGSPHADETPDHEYEGPSFEEMDPTGRYGRFKDVLGRGACKVVYKAFDTQEGTEVAWNQVRLSDLMATKDVAKEDRDRMFAEIRVLKALKHKNIMSFYDSWFEPKTLTVNFITELFTSGTLRQYRKRHKHVDSEVLKRWAWQILCGLVYLHGHNPPIIHRDLKCDNIFINGSDGVVKIGDLGLATMLRSRTAPQSVLGTPEFMAPELYEEDYDDRVDVYSFGMALLELSTLEYPYAECTNAAQIYRKVSLGVRPQGLQKVTSPELAEFINTCIAPRASRPRARQLLKHAYFDTVRQTLAPCKSEMSLVAAAAQGTAGIDAAAPLMDSPLVNDALAQVSGAEVMAEVPMLTLQQQQHQQQARSVTSSSSIGGGALVTSPEGSLAPPGSLPGGDTSSYRPGSDVASIRSQRSNVSELAAAMVGLDVVPPGAAADAGSRMASRASSRGPSPPDSPNRISPTGSDQEEPPATCRCALTDRCFRVLGKVRSDEANRGRTLLNLRLRITEPDGTTRTVEFEFDLTVDTVGSVASEMVLDLELSPEDADAITIAMRQEISKLAAKMEAEASMNLENAAHALQQGIMENALLQANSTALDQSDDDEPVGEDSVTSVQQGDPRPPPIEVNGESEATEKWEDATGTLLTALSADSLLSEASVASAQSGYSSQSSMQSIQSSPAQLAGESMQQSAASGPPLATQRLTRTVSMDRQLKATSIGHEQRNSSGALSPSSGILSPVSHHGQPDKRSLSKLFENLQEVAKEQERCGTPPPLCQVGERPLAFGAARPPLPPHGVNGHRLPPTRSSPPSIFAALIDSANGKSSNSLPPPIIAQGQVLFGEGSPDGGPLGTAVSLPVGDSAGLIAARQGAKLAARDKETLRKQAMDSAKLVELRSLNLLGTTLAGPKHARGTPMAANRPHSGTTGLVGSSGGSNGALAAAAEAGPVPASAPAPVPAAEQVPVSAAESATAAGG